MASSLGTLTATSSYDQVAQVIIAEAARRNYDPVPPLATAIQESGLRPGAINPAGPWVGIYQQDASYVGRYDPNLNIGAFFDRLDAKRKLPGWNADLWLNIFWLQQRPGEQSAAVAYANGRRAYLAEIKSRADEARRLVALYPPGTGTLVSDVRPLGPRPDFNEFPLWSPSNQSRGNTAIDLFLLHTQEGDGNAETLARYLGNPANQVSYHYTISVDLLDNGVTVVDVVDTDLASWSVGNANGRSINLCFAGSRASWSTEQWMRHQRAIDVAAYLAVQDCHKYHLPFTVLAPPYGGRRPPGISDHNYVTEVIGWGTHTDVGPNFPWPYFTERVLYWAQALGYLDAPPAPDPGPPAVVVPPGGQQPTDVDRELLAQIRGRWEMLGWQTPVEAWAEIRDAVLGTKDAGKKGFRW